MSTVTPEISGRNFEITPDIRQLIESKLSRVENRLFDDVISVRVVLEVEKYRNICEIFIVGKNYDVKTVQESDVSMADAIHAAIDHAKRQAQKKLEKLHDHHKHDGAAPEKILDEERR
jgi:putative sigma-54 modulation protein